MPALSNAKIGLALSGGAARGIAHIAVLDTLEMEGIPIHSIAGTSAGSVVGALYAAGMPVSEIKHILINTRWTNIIPFHFSRQGLISSEGIYRFMESVLPVKKFSSLLFPFAAVATDLRSGEKVSITTGSVARAVQASCSLPIVFTPTEINRRLLVDGGASSQIPVITAREELAAHRVIAVNVNYNAQGAGELNSMIKIAAHLSILWSGSNARVEERLADVLVNVNVKGISLYDLSKAKELLKRGRTATEEKLPEIRALVS